MGFVTDIASGPASPKVFAPLFSKSGRRIGLAIHDFGVGFTSFAYLKEFDAQEIKLNHSFVTGLTPGSFNASSSAA
ncbi:EAL domain-containing protein [Acidocella sp.]|jgi:EAL domain-containing protein (putative c-di-GMP-specific phosphodiesterase class I)|uniref:EAL domain-containing protein n=1 Tax=Acidocella sp. TaxID=50710 RepID=UPI002F408AFB